MLTNRWRRIATISGLLLFSFAAQTAAQNSSDSAATMRVSISIESEVITKQKPATVTLKIQNLSPRETDVKSISSFELFVTTEAAIVRKFSVYGDSYWSPVDLTSATSLKLDVDPKMLKKGVVQGRVPKAIIHFNADETKTFVLDLTKLHWNASMGSGWPRWSIFEAVPKGTYSLVFTLASDNDLKSNQAKVSVE